MGISLIGTICPFFNRAKAPILAPVEEAPGADRVERWALNAVPALARLNGLSEAALFSLLEKEVSNASQIIQEGERIARVPSQQVEGLVLPYLAQLKATAAKVQAVYRSQPGRMKRDAEIHNCWLRYGLPLNVLERHADFARFLYESKLLFAIVAFREGCSDSSLHGINPDADGHPRIKVQGQWRRWEDVKKEILYDPEFDQIKSAGYPGSIVQMWNYFHPNGLVPVDRFHWAHPFPVHQLSEAQYNRLTPHAQLFFQANRERDATIPKDCVLQFVTCPQKKGMPLFGKAFAPIRMRLIVGENRDVYSFGLEMPFQEKNQVLSGPSSTLFMTARGSISLLEEFNGDEGRLVTSIPLTAIAARNVLRYVEALNQTELTFPIMQQNRLASEVLSIAGYDVDFRASVAGVFWDALPSASAIPYIGCLIGKVQSLWASMIGITPRWIQSPLYWSGRALIAVPRLGVTLATNLLVWKMGGAKQTLSLQDNKSCSLISSYCDLLKQKTSVVYTSKRFIDWQQKQPSTVYYEAGTPSVFQRLS